MYHKVIYTVPALHVSLLIVGCDPTSKAGTKIAAIRAESDCENKLLNYLGKEDLDN